MDGDYACVIVDAVEQSILALHDQLGLKPLFFMIDDHCSILGTDLAAVAELIDDPAIDEEFIADYLSTAEPWGHRTPFKAISRLLPGQALVLSPLTHKMIDCWMLGSVDAARFSASDAPEAVLDTMKAAITAACAGGRKPCAQLSGGLDSSSVVSLCRDRLGLAPPLLSVVYDQCYQVDERVWMQHVINRYPSPWHQIDGEACLPFSGEPYRVLGEPSEVGLRPEWDRRWAALTSALDVDVMLTGEGGDIVLLGDDARPIYLADRLSRGSLHGVLHEASTWALAERNRRSVLFGLRQFIAKPIWRRLTRTPLDFAAGQAPWIARDFGRRMTIARRGARAWLPRSETLADGVTLQRLVMMGRILSTISHQQAIPIAIRHPLLDLRLIRLMLSIPWDQKIAPGRDRILHRAAMTGILPDAIRRRETKGGSDQSWVTGLERSDFWFELLTRDPIMVREGFVDGAQWRKAVDQARIARSDDLNYFDRAASLEAWLYSREHLTRPKPFMRQIAEL